MTADQVSAGAAQAVPADPADERRERVADAVRVGLRQWAALDIDGTRGVRKWDFITIGVLEALPELAAADRLRARLAALADEMTTKAAELDEDARAMQAAGDHQAANSLTVRCGMTYFLADRLRALLEET